VQRLQTQTEIEMTGTIEITVKVYLCADVDGKSDEVRKIVQDVVDGELNPMIDNIELVSFQTEDE